MSDVAQRIGEKLKNERKNLGWSQDKLARACGLSVRAYGAIERGTTNPKLSTLDKICEALKMNMSDLFKVD